MRTYVFWKLLCLIVAMAALTVPGVFAAGSGTSVGQFVPPPQQSDIKQVNLIRVLCSMLPENLFLVHLYGKRNRPKQQRQPTLTEFLLYRQKDVRV